MSQVDDSGLHQQVRLTGGGGRTMAAGWVLWSLRRHVVTMVVGGSLVGADAAPLCRRLQAAFDQAPIEVVVCDLHSISTFDLGAVETLAQVQLVVRRRGGRLRLERPPSPLRDLLVLAGLGDALTPNA